MTTTSEVLEFQAEITELLHLMINSLYTRKDIFLRELISNASDALDCLRFESLTEPELLKGNEKLEIRINIDSVLRTLTISDSGIGMTRGEVIANIGTIAKSGIRECYKKLQHGESAAHSATLIGQFGVGFYSAFMVADKVKLLTRRAGECAATEWVSEARGTYEIRDAEKSERGTTITLFLKNPDPENGVEDYTDYWCVSRIVKEHSDFISYPIVCERERLETGPNGSSNGQQIATGNTTLNSMKPIWNRFPTEVRHEEYAEFYKHISHDRAEPLKSIHFKAEGTFEYDALLYVPSIAPYDLYYLGSTAGLRLYSRRVMVIERCPELLPHYLRFVCGVVDGVDLPLNISRQRLQNEHYTSLIRKRLTRKLLDSFQELFEKQHDQYLAFWREFGRAMKEGISSDCENEAKILALLLFESSVDPEKLSTLAEYVLRMKPDQEQILYLSGESRSVVESSPHMEAVRAQGYEVLYMLDPVDELMLQHLPEFDGKKLKSVGKGEIKLGQAKEKAEAAEELKQRQQEYKPLLDFLQRKLEPYIKQVRLSTRLTTSPACLVVDDHDYSPMLERLLQKGKGSEPKGRRVLELNADHSVISRMRQRHATDPSDPLIVKAAEILLGLALLLEGSRLPDPVRFNGIAIEVLCQVF